MTTDVEFLTELAEKFERETQVFLGYRNAERAERLRSIIAKLPAEQPPHLSSEQLAEQYLASLTDPEFYDAIIESAMRGRWVKKDS